MTNLCACHIPGSACIICGKSSESKLTESEGLRYNVLPVLKSKAGFQPASMKKRQAVLNGRFTKSLTCQSKEEAIIFKVRNEKW
jgi:hypothetical protein